MLDVAIIGCGVVGAAAAYELSHYPLHVAVLEAENDVADGTTKANSAILHAGYDPEPGTQMARLNVQGVALAKEICARLDVPYRQCGSLVLALSQAELPHLQKLSAKSKGNRQARHFFHVVDNRQHVDTLVIPARPSTNDFHLIQNREILDNAS